jgi:hypothetical protein
MNGAKPNLFALMTRLTAEERQKFGERRRAMKAKEGIDERLVEGENGWRLEYWAAGKKVGELLISRA